MASNHILNQLSIYSFSLFRMVGLSKFPLIVGFITSILCVNTINASDDQQWTWSSADFNSYQRYSDHRPSATVASNHNVYDKWEPETSTSQNLYDNSQIESSPTQIQPMENVPTTTSPVETQPHKQPISSEIQSGQTAFEVTSLPPNQPSHEPLSEPAELLNEEPISTPTHEITTTPTETPVEAPPETTALLETSVHHQEILEDTTTNHPDSQEDEFSNSSIENNVDEEPLSTPTHEITPQPTETSIVTHPEDTAMLETSTPHNEALENATSTQTQTPSPQTDNTTNLKPNHNEEPKQVADNSWPSTMYVQEKTDSSWTPISSTEQQTFIPWATTAPVNQEIPYEQETSTFEQPCKPVRQICKPLKKICKLEAQPCETPTGPARCYDDSKVRFFIEGDYLYWQTNLSGVELDFGRSSMAFGTVAGVTTTTTNEFDIDPDFEWQSGYRVGCGIQLPCSNVAFGADWTQFENTGHRSINGNNGIVNHGTCKVLFEQFDVVAEYNAKWGAISFVPFFGLRGAQINTSVKAAIETDITLAANTSATEIRNLDDHQYFKGIGPLLGFFADWEYGYGFGIYGDAAYGLLYGNYKLKFNDSDVFSSPIASQTLSLNQRHMHRFNSTLDMALGLYWHTCICQMADIGLKLGFEHHEYFDVSYLGTDRGDICFDGLTASLELTF